METRIISAMTGLEPKRMTVRVVGIVLKREIIASVNTKQRKQNFVDIDKAKMKAHQF
jgi:hypothetical protein